ncbi:MAG: squalene/phytoene synthase family protein [Planctomycetota bacterium]|nr:squalene/phytoene synthase family protein [Planctomycetota bacterium]
MISPDQLERSRAYCREITRRRARNFYLGLRLTPEPKRSSLYAIYAWMRRADDIVDGDADDVVASPAGRAAELERFASDSLAICDAVAGSEGGGSVRWPRASEPATSNAPGQTGDTFWPAFTQAIQSYKIERALIEDVFTSLRRDLDPLPMPSENELRSYCRGVASTVGVACIRVWGLRAGATSDDMARVDELASRRGLAFQLTNILRDVGCDYDAEPRRVYLPADSLARAGLSASDLRHWREADRCAAFIREWCHYAEREFIATEPLDDLVHSDGRAALQAMTRTYRTLLGRLRERPELCVGPAASVPRRTKLWIASRALLEQWVASRA